MSLVLLIFANLTSGSEAALIYPRVVMASEGEGLSPFPSHDYPEYETSSKQYENGSITYFEVINGLPRPYHNTSPP